MTTGVAVQGNDPRWGVVNSLITNPAFALFVSANLINVGNLGFNVLFSRWMGPDAFGDLALLLTVKLSLLSVLNAVQFEIAGRIASLNSATARHVAGGEINRISRKLVVVTLATLALFVMAAWLFMPQGASDSHHLQVYTIFALSLPFMAPLSFVRGWSQGSLSIKKIVLSGQIEMMVRFVGAGIAWVSGAGLPGIALAIVLSIIAGWYFARPDAAPEKTELSKYDEVAGQLPGRSVLLKGLFVAALPWACLQFGQVLALDGDFLAAKMQLDSTQAGLSAVTVLVQRILFFGCFGLATAILPMAVSLETRTEVWRAIKPVLLLLAGTCLPVVAVMTIAPNLFVNVLFGEQFMPVSRSLFYAAFSGTCFVVVYLIATFFLARSKSYFGYLVLSLAILQVCALTLVPTIVSGADMHTVVKIKSLIQFGTALLIIGAAIHEYTKLRRT